MKSFKENVEINNKNYDDRFNAIIKPQEYPKKLMNSIFLAGPCPRKKTDDDWRDDFCKKLIKKGFKGDIINPTNRNWVDDEPNYYQKQCQWEQDMMKMSSVVIFRIDRNAQHPALTTNIEFGKWSDRPNDIIVCIPPKSEKCNYIINDCKINNIPLCDNDDDLIDMIIKRFNRPQKTFYTADTHLGAKRTFELSKRPFKNVHEMDMQIVSNWNKKITCNDVVYHLGDFGDSKYLSLLNYKELHIIEGNYERKEALSLPSDRNIFYHHNPILKKLDDGEEVLLMHEPISVVEPEHVVPSDTFCFFAHSHRVDYKRNGINVGIDSYLDFAPLSEKECLFWKDAVQKYYDDNAFVERCEF